MIVIIVAVMLGVAGLSFVLYPFYLPMLVKGAPVSLSYEPTLSSEGTISEREQAARSALQEVELDYQLGNISDEDYNILRERYVRRALRALKSRYEQDKQLTAINSVSSESNEDELNDSNDYDSDIDEMIENELRRLREQGNRENDAAN
jgi:hypothetical protein